MPQFVVGKPDKPPTPEPVRWWVEERHGGIVLFAGDSRNRWAVLEVEANGVLNRQGIPRPEADRLGLVLNRLGFIAVSGDV